MAVLWHFAAGWFSEDVTPRANSFRIGKVTGYLRGRVRDLCSFEHGKSWRKERHQPEA